MMQKTNVEAAQILCSAGVNISPEGVRQWCGGYARPDIGKIKAIAAALGCTVNYLFGIDEYPDADITDISKKTGLSAAAVEAIQNCKEKDFLNDFLSSSRLNVFLNCAKEAVIAEAAPHPETVPGQAAPMIVDNDSPGYFKVHGSIAASLFWDYASNVLKLMGQEIIDRTQKGSD
jgi:transcriptional regulator with XRE-family HTH domain